MRKHRKSMNINSKDFSSFKKTIMREVFGDNSPTFPFGVEILDAQIRM